MPKFPSMTWLACVSLVALGTAAGATTADPLAKSAMRAYLKTNNAAETDQAVAEAREKLQLLAATEPAATGVANVVLKRGLDHAALAALVNRSNAAPVEVEMKTPIGTSGDVMTMWVFQPALGVFGGTLAEQLEFVVARQRSVYAQRAQAATDPGTAARMSQVAQSNQIRFYRVKVLGTTGELRNLLGEADVAAAFVDIDRERMPELAAQKAALNRPRPAGRVVRHRRQSDGSPF